MTRETHNSKINVFELIVVQTSLCFRDSTNGIYAFQVNFIE